MYLFSYRPFLTKKPEPQAQASSSPVSFENRPIQRPVTQVKPVPQSPPTEDLDPVPSAPLVEESKTFNMIQTKKHEISMSEPSSPVMGRAYPRPDSVSSDPINELSNAEKIRSLRQSFANLF